MPIRRGQLELDVAVPFGEAPQVRAVRIDAVDVAVAPNLSKVVV
jgi:hypothetical protein